MEEIRLAAQKCRNLEDIRHLCHRLCLKGLMDVRHDGNLKLLLDGFQHFKALFHARTAKAVVGGTVRLVEGSLEDIGNPQTFRNFLDGAPNQKAALHALQYARTGQKRQWLSSAYLKIPDLYLVHASAPFKSAILISSYRRFH